MYEGLLCLSVMQALVRHSALRRVSPARLRAVGPAQGLSPPSQQAVRVRGRLPQTIAL